MPPDVLHCALAPLEDTWSLVRACCVCRSWSAAALDAPALWRFLQLSGAGGRLSDTALARLVARARGQLESAVLDGAHALTDACLALLAPAASPRLSELSLKGCSRLTFDGVVAALRGARLCSLKLDGVRRSAAHGGDAEALLDALGGALDADSEADVWGACQAERCHRLLAGDDDEGAAECDVCGEPFCNHCLHRCTRCATARSCASCLPDACASGYEDPITEGFRCALPHGCGAFLCGDCGPAAVFRSDRVTHLTCGVCGLDYCTKCAFGFDDKHPRETVSSAGVVCSGLARYTETDPETCRRFMCTGCLWDGNDERLIMCRQCNIPYCDLCVEKGALRLTGRLTSCGPSVTEGFCRLCSVQRARGRNRL